MELVEAVYKVTRAFPKEELFGLTSQMRRAAVSIPSNIAEGQGRNTAREFLQYLSIAYGSLRELETQVLISFRLAYLGKPELASLTEQTGQVGRLINGLTRSLC